MARKPLGRGLSALLGSDEPATAATPAVVESVNEIDIDLIDPNPDQPRTRFTDKALDELAQSIAVNGVVQPIVVRKLGNRYQIVAGERRWRASQRAGLRRIPAVAKEVGDDKLLELALIENIQRQELNPIEEASAYRNLIDSIGLTQEQVAERVGKERSLVATSLRLLKLPDDIQTLIAEEKLSAGHGRALLMSDDPTVQRRIARAAMEKSLSVRETEKMVKAAASKKTANVDSKAVKAVDDPNVKAAETKLMRRFGTNVKILPKSAGSGGRIEVCLLYTS
ncbi:MAG: ParB/RepB/Spo0J family partition protein, partial [Pyrinomonadaceae bacterium]|nr:ParB/RepB/Spo0J family partition protein [Pyrinomonadaceae bacterium]